MWLALVGCLDPLPRMRSVPVGPFEDRSGAACAPEVVSAWGGPHRGAAVQAVVGRGDRLLVFREADDEAWLTTLDVTDPQRVVSLGSGRLPGIGWVGTTGVHGDTVLASWRRGGEQLAAIAAETPWAPEVLDTVELGRDGDPTGFASLGDLAFTDGGDVHAVDLRDPTALSEVTFAGLGLLGAPVAVGTTLLVSEDRGPVGDGCSAVAYDGLAAPPTEQARVETSGCASAGQVEVDGGVLGLGWRDGQPIAEALSIEPLAVTGEVDLDPTGLDQLDVVLAVDGGALALGSGRGAFVRVKDGAPRVAATWRPATGFLESASVANELAWVVVSHESGDFEGVVALSFRGCP